MATDFSAPSFSLGIDLDFEEEDHQREEEPLIPKPANQEEGLDDLELGDDLDRTDTYEPRRPALKRLRRGPPPPPPPPPPPATFADGGNLNLDDDIEDFSSQEDADSRNPDISQPLQSHATSSSSKLSLSYRGVLSSQSASKLKTSNISPAYNASASKSFEASSNNYLFPRITISPIRKIHLLDSDSDDPSSSKGKVNSKNVDPSNKKRNPAPFQRTIGNDERTFQSSKHQPETFWKDFSPKENVNLKTPALDEFCDEYFKSAKDQKVGQHKEVAPSFCSPKVLDPDDSVDDSGVPLQQESRSRADDHGWDFPHPKPPAYQYFYHDDVRIRALVRARLHHFIPIGAENRGRTQQFGEDLDYMGQFCAGEGPSQARATNRTGSERHSKTKQRKPSTGKRKEAPQAAGNWVNPRGSSTVPKDAGKRRVSAVGSESGGHWFTGQDGRKVYISKNGQELTGRIAYGQYKKDTGAGFRKGKKKSTTGKKKATAGKKKK